jgi:hypothetical protein
MPVGRSINHDVPIEPDVLLFYARGLAELGDDSTGLWFRPVVRWVLEETSVIERTVRAGASRCFDDILAGNFFSGLFNWGVLTQPDSVVQRVLPFSAQLAFGAVELISSPCRPRLGPECIAYG